MRRTARLLLVLLAGAGCANSAGAPNVPADGGAGGTGYGHCANDSTCQPGGCVAGICVPAATFPTPLAVEISPALVGTSAALAEVPVAPATWKLKTNRTVVANAGFVVPDGVPFPWSASAIVSVASLIPGRPSLSFENPITPGDTALMINVPSAVGDRAGTLGLIPLSPADATFPPYRFAVPSVVGPTSLKFPTNVQNQTPHGQLLDAFHNPKTTYSARAFLVDGTLVSNVAALQTDGSFVLFIPSAVTGELSIELAPASSNDPWFTFNKMTLTTQNQDLGTVTLPAYQVPKPVVFTVRGNDTGAPVSSAILRASTILQPDTSMTTPPGTTRFWQSAMTGTNGEANLSLIPGVGQTPRPYDVVVVPPAASTYASTCVPQQPVLGEGNAGTIMLPLRPVISGTVTSAQGTIVSGVTVTASRPADQAKVCSTSGSVLGPTAFTTTTDRTGTFKLPLDPGTYQLDFDPPAGAAPRLTEYAFMVSDATTHPVQLPPPGLIDGDVSDAEGVPLPQATIRIFEPRCPTTDGCTLPPILRAQTQSDDNGHFRAVVALPNSN